MRRTGDDTLAIAAAINLAIGPALAEATEIRVFEDNGFYLQTRTTVGQKCIGSSVTLPAGWAGNVDSEAVRVAQYALADLRDAGVSL